MRTRGSSSRGSYTRNTRKRSSGSRRYSRGGGYGRSGSKIAHSKYISQASEVEVASVYKNEKSFTDFGLSPVLVKNIADMGYEHPTKIQDQAIPEILKGNDLVGIGKTGSGKTSAFLIPAIEKALKDRGNNVLIMSPTRELANQIGMEFAKLAKNTGLKHVLIRGGEGYGPQIRLLREKRNFVMATPGRLIDLEKKNHIDLSTFNNIILDEVDRMLDMGFVKDIQYLISKLGQNRQSLFFSATLSSREESIANRLLNNPVKIESDTQSPLKTIDQDIVKVSHQSEKFGILHGLLEKEEFRKVLVFSRTKRGADKISRELLQKGIKVAALHGDKSQSKRSRILARFRRNEIDVLIATDVAARGIDVPNITHVINYDEPATYNDYIHRIGRTGRIGKKGVALTFVS